ncbi:NUDIX hydrolase [Mycobacterium shigaense]|uniref:NUDIX hydrolase n=1 Tax=Mycobacterium shigaense TaxID=722731 RepID=UPI00280AB28F|nr:NUDIX hydrolase [Mycobacterium shigaense]
MREAHEETGLDPTVISVTGSVVTSRPAGTEWTYTTVLAATHTTPTLAGSADSAELAWVPVADGSTWRCTLAWPRAGHKLRSVVCARPQ